MIITFLAILTAINSILNVLTLRKFNKYKKKMNVRLKKAGIPYIK